MLPLGLRTPDPDTPLHKELAAWRNHLRPTQPELEFESHPQHQGALPVAISLDTIDLPSGDFLSKEEKERIRDNQEAFFLTGGEPKVTNTAEPVKPNGEANYQTILQIIIRDPATGDEQERLMGLSHSRKREALAIAAVQASDKIGPCYLDQLPPSKPGWSGVWVINSTRNPAYAGNKGGKAKGSGDVPWEDA